VQVLMVVQDLTTSVPGPFYIGHINLASVAVISAIVAVMLLALRENLRSTFATLERVADIKSATDRCAAEKDLNRLGAKVNTLSEAVFSNKEMAKEALTRAEAAKTEVIRHGENIERNLIKPIGEISRKLAEISEGQAAQVEINKRIELSLTDLRRERDKGR
jgi:hypothetical protein